MHIEGIRQVGHCEYDTVNSPNHKGDVVAMVARQGEFVVVAKVENETPELVSSDNVDKLQPLAARVKILIFNNCKKFALNVDIYEQLKSTA